MSVRISPDKCIACTTCVVHCPVARVTPKFLGPRMIGPAYERFRLLGLAEDESLTYCANCKNCDITCPQGVPVSSINMLARAEHCRKHGAGLRDWVLAHGELEAKLLQLIPAGLKNFGMLNPVTRKVLDMLGIDRRAPLPPFAPKTFRQLARKLEQPSLPRKVVFFPGCYVDVYDPQTGLDMIWAFNRAGYEVITPEKFGCCGLPMIANGFWKDSRRQAKRNLAELARWREQGIPVVNGCPSCALMFRADLPEFFPDLVEKYGMGVLEDAQDFLLECVERDELPLDAAPAAARDLRIIYHAPCHLRAQGNGLPGLRLLRHLKGVTALNADAGCCGISGSYGFKKEKYDIAQEIGAELFHTVRESGAAFAASECGTCRVQIRHGSGKTALHPVSILRMRLEGRQPSGSQG